MEKETSTQNDKSQQEQPKKDEQNYFVLEDGKTPIESEGGQEIIPESEQDDKSKK